MRLTDLRRAGQKAGTNGYWTAGRTGATAGSRLSPRSSSSITCSAQRYPPRAAPRFESASSPHGLFVFCNYKAHYAEVPALTVTSCRRNVAVLTANDARGGLSLQVSRWCLVLS